MKRFHRTLRNGRGKLLRTKKAITRTASDVKDRLVDVQGDVLNYAKQHPLKTVGISLIAGALVAKILRSRR